MNPGQGARTAWATFRSLVRAVTLLSGTRWLPVVITRQKQNREHGLLPTLW